MITVFHFNMEQYHSSRDLVDLMLGEPQDLQRLVKETKYTRVAEVNTDDKNVAFRLTNHIDSSWQDNQHVTPYGDCHRSTSVGDVMVDGDGKTWVVARFGFEQINTN